MRLRKLRLREQRFAHEGLGLSRRLRPASVAAPYPDPDVRTGRSAKYVVVLLGEASAFN
jgi:hypothetical protein